MEYITTKEASVKWGISVSRIGILVNEGRIPGAQRIGKSWLIPANAVKPAKRTAGYARRSKTETKTKDFAFPLYHFRPDWNDAKAAQLNEEQRSLFLAQKAVLECRFEDALPLLEAILRAPEDIYMEIGALWNIGMCCIALNKVEDFFSFFLRLQLLFSQDFPHRDDLIIFVDFLKTYVDPIESSAKITAFRTEVHPQALPMVCVLKGFTLLVKEIVKTGSVDTSLMELNLLLLETTSATIAVEMMHCYLLGIYSLRQNAVEAERHAKALVQLAYENKIYFPLVFYYNYNVSAFAPILAQYPEDFRELCLDLSLQLEKNYKFFVTSINENTVLARISDTDFPYAIAVLQGLSNVHIAEEMNISLATVNRRLEKLYEKLGVRDKKELRDYLQHYL